MRASEAIAKGICGPGAIEFASDAEFYAYIRMCNEHSEAAMVRELADMATHAERTHRLSILGKRRSPEAIHRLRLAVYELMRAPAKAAAQARKDPEAEAARLPGVQESMNFDGVRP